MPAATGRFHTPTLVAGATLVVLAGLVWLLPSPALPGPRADAGGGAEADLVLLCAASVGPPVEDLARAYRERYGVRIEIQLGGSGTLLARMAAGGGPQARSADLYLAGDERFVERARREGLVAESLPLAIRRPVIGVAAGNPLGVATLEDLGDLRLGLASPDATALGKLTRELLELAGVWEELSVRAEVLEPTVGDLAEGLRRGALDAAILWDATARQVPEIEGVHAPMLDGHPRRVAIGVLTGSPHPTAALGFARFLSSRDVGGPVFQERGYTPVEGDPWEEHPSLDVMCGAMLRPAVDETISAFAQREGVQVRRTYNGCGLLVSQMKAGAPIDAYLACDVSFLEMVRENFDEGTVISANPIVIGVAQGNPRDVRTLADLAKAGLRVGLADGEKSALGALTRRLLRRDEVEQELLLSGNVQVTTPTADMLVQALVAGALDATVVYTSSAAAALDELELLPISLRQAEAAQVWAIARDSDHQLLAGRLLEALTTAGSRSRFVELGFTWRHDGER